MAFSSSHDKIFFLYAEGTDTTVCEAFREMTEKVLPIPLIRVQKTANSDFEKAMDDSWTGFLLIA